MPSRITRARARSVWPRLALLLGLAASASADIASLVVDAPAFRPAEPGPVLASQAELNLALDATPSRYRFAVERADTPGTTVGSRIVDHAGALGTPVLYRILVPLNEGSNTFVARVFDQNQTMFTATAPVSPDLARDSQNTSTAVRLDRLDPLDFITNQATVDLTFTIFGTSATYAVEVERNGGIIQLTPGIGRGQQTLTGIPILEGPNFFRVRVTSSDGLSTDPMVTSNVLRITRDTAAPTVSNLVISPGTPTDLAVIAISGDTEAFANVTIDDGAGGVFSKRADALGNFFIGGVGLPLMVPGPTTTIFQVEATDLAGNTSGPTPLAVTRTAAEPRFEFIRLTPQDGSAVEPDVALQVDGVAGMNSGPFTVRFRARQGTTGPFLEETISVLGAGQPFQKDLILVPDSSLPGLDTVWSVDAQVESTAGTSSIHRLGAVVLDVEDPPPFSTLDPDFDAVPVFGSAQFTLEGAAERDSAVQFVGLNGLNVLPTTLIPTVPSNIAQGGELRSVVDATGLLDGDYTVITQVTALSGRTSPTSRVSIPFQLDRTPPRAVELRVGGVDVQTDGPLFRRRNQLVTLTVRVDEEMPEPPEVIVTQQGLDGRRAVLDTVQIPGRAFDYLAVTDDSQLFDGPVEVLVLGGADRAQNPIFPAQRFPGAFVVDTRAPRLDPARTVPADGSLITSPPAPLRVTLVEPGGVVPESGPAASQSQIRVLGPLETTPGELQPGRVEAFDPLTLEYTADPGSWDEDGTYLVEVEAHDRAGNITTQVLTLILDTAAPGPAFVVETVPSDGAAVPATGIPVDVMGNQFVAARFDVSSPMDLDLDRSTVSLRSACPIPFDVEGELSTLAPDSRVFTLDRPLAPDGGDDGVFSLLARPADPAGNLGAGVIANFVYDTVPPVVLTGLQQSFPGSPVGTDATAFPADQQIVRGPLRQASVVIQDGVASNGFTGSGVLVEPTTGTEIVLTLVGQHPTTTAPVGFSTASSAITTLRFQELTAPELSPCFLGLRRTRVLLDLFTDPVTGDPAGLPADGTFDGLWEVRTRPVDRAGNTGAVTRTRFTYDTRPPFVELDLVLNDKVYTGNRLTLTGRARDNDKGPRDQGQGLRRVQVALESQPSAPLTTFFRLIDFTDAILSPDVDLVQSEVLLPWRFDQRIPAFEGNARVIVRAEDMAGNETFLVREVVLDVDPLEPPVLVAPTNRAALPGAVVRFEWQHVEGACRYRLRIRDQDGNEVTRVVDLPFRHADVNLGSLTPGPYTWTVEAIDTGGTAGQPAAARRFTLDTGFPEVVRVVPFDATAPDAGAGAILGGQVRLAIEFSEPMDTARPPTVLLDPANPSTPTTTVSQFSFVGDTWRGAVDVPPSADAPDYNGLASVIIRDAFDPAGNPLPETRVNFEVDLGPFWEVRAFANPVLKREVIFYFRARDSVQGPLEEVQGMPDITVQQMGAAPRFLRLRKLTPSIFYGTYEVDRSLPGLATLRITATDMQGNTSTRALAFSVAAILRADENNVRFASGALTVQVPRNAAPRDEVVTILPPRLDSPSLGPSQPDQPPHPELELVRRLDRLVPGALPLDRPARARVELAGYGLRAEDGHQGLGLYLKRGDRYLFQPGAVAGGVLTSQVDSLETFYLMRDMTAPRVDPDRPVEAMDGGRVVKVPLLDLGAGLDVGRCLATLGGKPLRMRYQRGEQTLYVELPGRGGGTVELTAPDRVGNVAQLQLGVAGSREVTRLVPYPNPARVRSTLRYQLGAAAPRVRVSIYDTAGRRVRSLRGPAAAGSNELTWDLRDGRGRRVANGVYFADLRVEGGGRARTKVAVLR